MAYRNRPDRRRVVPPSPPLQAVVPWTFTVAAGYIEVTFTQPMSMVGNPVMYIAKTDHTAVIPTGYTQTTSTKVRVAVAVNLTAEDFVCAWQYGNGNLRSVTGGYPDPTFQFSPLPP